MHTAGVTFTLFFEYLTFPVYNDHKNMADYISPGRDVVKASDILKNCKHTCVLLCVASHLYALVVETEEQQAMHNKQ